MCLYMETCQRRSNVICKLYNVTEDGAVKLIKDTDKKTKDKLLISIQNKNGGWTSNYTLSLNSRSWDMQGVRRLIHGLCGYLLDYRNFSYYLI